jgi:hypothetical protein
MGRNLKRILLFATNMNNECWEGLEFGDLTAGDRYISLPIPGDNSKPGSGFKNTYHLLQKIQSVTQNNQVYNSVELRNGRVIHTPEDIPVIKVE